MKLGVPIQQPDDRLDYDVSYKKWLADTGDSIDTVTVESSPTGLSASGVVVADDRIKVWAEGGEDGDIYFVEITVETLGGRIKEDELEFRIVEYT